MNSTTKLIIFLGNNCVINFMLFKTWNEHIVIICLWVKHLNIDVGKKFLFLGSVG